MEPHVNYGRNLTLWEWTSLPSTLVMGNIFPFVFYSIAFKMAYMSWRAWHPDWCMYRRLSAKTRTGATHRDCSPDRRRPLASRRLYLSSDALLTLSRMMKIGVGKKKTVGNVGFLIYIKLDLEDLENSSLQWLINVCPLLDNQLFD